MKGKPEIDISNQRFGQLIALRRFDSLKNHARWLFRCDCGWEGPMFKHNVVRGHILSCLACGHERQNQAITRHGRHKDPIYQIYHAARQRCLNPHDARYRDYGGRGIEFRFHSFQEFAAHMGPRPEGTTLDRCDNDGHYELGNVRWATPLEQANNRRPKRPVQSVGKPISALCL